MSDILDDILEAIPAPVAPAVQADEQEKKPSMEYSPEFEKQYGKKA